MEKKISIKIIKIKIIKFNIKLNLKKKSFKITCEKCLNKS